MAGATPEAIVPPGQQEWLTPGPTTPGAEPTCMTTTTKRCRLMACSVDPVGALAEGSCDTVRMPDEGFHEGEVCSVKGCNVLASTEITSTLPKSGLPALYFVCDEHASNFKRGGRSLSIHGREISTSVSGDDFGPTRW